MITNKQRFSKHTTMAAGILSLLAMANSHAHISYPTGGSRDFGTLIPGGPAVSLATNPTVTGDYGWADGTDADFGDSHKVRGLRFTLAVPATITLTIDGSGSGLLPGFSIYSGLAHLGPFGAGESADHDFSLISQAYLGTLGGIAKEGVFTALDSWKIGGDGQTGPVFDFSAANGLSDFTYMGHAVDGTSANYGSAAGIIGDGVADGRVSGTFSLPAGNYSIFVGGANYGGASATNYAFSASIVAVPEPSTTLACLAAACGLTLRRRRN